MKPDPFSRVIVVFLQSWKNLKCYVFLSLCLIERGLRKVQVEMETIFLVTAA